MSPRRVLLVHPSAEVRDQLREILGESENEYVEAASRKEAAGLLAPAPSLVVSHHDDFKKLIADLDRKAPAAIRVVLSPAGEPEVLDELDGIASSGFEFLTLAAGALWKLKTMVARRASPRHHVSEPVQATLVSRGVEIEGTCIDVSNEGVGVVVPVTANLAALMPGEPVVLKHLRRGETLLMEQVPCSVQTVRRVEGSNALQVGAVFEPARRTPAAPLRITNGLRINALIRSAIRSGETISISAEGTSLQRFSGARLEGGRLHLTEALAHREQWEPGQAVTVSFEINGRQLFGYASVLVASSSRVVLAVPLAFSQVNRRTSLRVAPGSFAAQVTIVSPLNGQRITRPLLDLSSIGASFQADSALDVFPPGLRLDEVVLELGEERVRVSAVVASSGHAGDGLERRCGLQFTAILPRARQVLLDHLVRNLVEGAECGSSLSFGTIWNFFASEGAAWRDHPGLALAPAKAHELLGEGAHALSKTFVITRDGELQGHTSGLRIYSRTWLSQHLMVKTGYHRSAALSQQLMCLSFDYGEALPDVEYVRGLWRVSNRWAERIYGAASVRMIRPGLAYRVQFEPMRLPLDRPLPPALLHVRDAGPDDESAFLRHASATQDPVKLLSDDLVQGELHLESLARRFGALGLSRGRSLRVVEDAHGTPLGWALLETMSDGLFWAEMYNSFRIFLADPLGPSASQARRALALDAAAAFARLGRREAECHAGQGDEADLAALGFVSLGPVYEFGAHRSQVRELTGQVISVFARIRRREKEEASAVDSIESERPTA